jgi:hypothetical protein
MSTLETKRDICVFIFWLSCALISFVLYFHTWRISIGDINVPLENDTQKEESYFYALDPHCGNIEYQKLILNYCTITMGNQIKYSETCKMMPAVPSSKNMMITQANFVNVCAILNICLGLLLDFRKNLKLYRSIYIIDLNLLLPPEEIQIQMKKMKTKHNLKIFIVLIIFVCTTIPFVCIWSEYQLEYQDENDNIYLCRPLSTLNLDLDDQLSSLQCDIVLNSSLNESWSHHYHYSDAIKWENNCSNTWITPPYDANDNEKTSVAIFHVAYNSSKYIHDILESYRNQVSIYSYCIFVLYNLQFMVLVIWGTYDYYDYKAYMKAHVETLAQEGRPRQEEKYINSHIYYHI